MSTKRVSLTEASGHLAELIDAAGRGDEIVIEAEGKTPVRLTLVKPERGKRELGVYRGKIRMRDDFNEPLPEDFLVSGQP
jgi:antitoxin (DNA-binding transcriptional repressor) of toxin-antitoxin stability system